MDEREQVAAAIALTLPRLLALERCGISSACEYLAWLLVVGDRCAVTVDIKPPHRVALWRSVAEVRDAYGPDVFIDADPERHMPPGVAASGGYGTEGKPRPVATVPEGGPPRPGPLSGPGAASYRTPSPVLASRNRGEVGS